MNDIKNRITNSPVARRMAYYAGWSTAKRIWRRLFVKGPTVFILMYHKIAPNAYPYYGVSVTPNIFEKQIRTIVKHYQVVALEELADMQNFFGRKDIIAITFDDGYKGVYRWAFPILRKFDLPATVFLTTDLIGSNQLLWPDYLAFMLHSAVEHRSFAGINLSEFPANIAESIQSFFNSKINSAHKLKLLSQMTTDLRSFNKDDRIRILDALCRRLRASAPFDFSEVMLSWQEVQAMSKQRIFFGSHTRSHEALSALLPESVEAELLDSKDRIESQLQKSVTTFAYPYGKENDFTAENVEQVKRCGFQLAVTGIRGNETLPLRNPYTLLRRAVENTPYLFF